MFRRRGRILAVKWGLNPNSSSLGVDVTFLLFGAAALSLFTPVVSALVRWRTPIRGVGGDVGGDVGDVGDVGDARTDGVEATGDMVTRDESGPASP